MNDYRSSYYRLTARLADSQPKGITSLTNGWLRCLAYVYRYSAQPRLHPQNVPEHSFFTAVLAYSIATDMKLRGIQVDPNLAASKALFHDLEEALTGDITLPMKYHSKDVHDAVKKSGDEMLLDALSRDLNLGIADDIYELWLNAKDDTLEGRIVAFCDVLEALGYNIEERNMGNVRAAEIVVGNARRLFSPYMKFDEFSPYLADLLDLDREAFISKEQS